MYKLIGAEELEEIKKTIKSTSMIGPKMAIDKKLKEIDKKLKEENNNGN